MLGSVWMLIVRRPIKGRKQNGKRWRGTERLASGDLNHAACLESSEMVEITS